MKRRKVKSPICQYGDIDELTPEILREVVWRIEITHSGKKQGVLTKVSIFGKLNGERS